MKSDELCSKPGELHTMIMFLLFAVSVLIGFLCWSGFIIDVAEKTKKKR
jgi:hypothetical protein